MTHARPQPRGVLKRLPWGFGSRPAECKTISGNNAGENQNEEEEIVMNIEEMLQNDSDKVWQAEGLPNAPADDVAHPPDKDGDFIMGGPDLASNPTGARLLTVRVPSSMPEKDAVRILRKIVEWIEHDGRLLAAKWNC